MKMKKGKSKLILLDNKECILRQKKVIKVTEDEGWVELYSTNNEYEAHLILGLLESNGVPAQLKSFRVSQFPFDIGHIGEIKVMVMPENLDEAKRLIENPDK